MNQQRLMQVLLAPQISEKATYVADKHNQVIFRVASDATKPEIKAAVELVVARAGKKPTLALRPVRKLILLKGGMPNGSR